MPRFIINIREMYDRDLQDRWQGIDTGFGLIEEGQVVESVMDHSAVTQRELLGNSEQMV